MNARRPETGFAKASPNTPDESKIKRRVFWELLSSRWTLWPFLAGVTVLAALWTFGIRSGVAAFAGITMILGAVGVFFTRLLLGSEALFRKMLAKIQQETQAEHERALDDLERELVATQGDRRDETCLRDLRALMKAFGESRACSAAVTSRLTFDILAGVGHLFEACMFSLRKTLELWRTAEKMSTPEARAPILEQRNRIIEDVQKSVTQLGHLLAGIQTFGASEDVGKSELARIRAELDQSLEVARRVEKRMQSLDDELGAATPGAEKNGKAGTKTER